MRFIPGQDSFSISYRGGRAFDDNFTVDFFPGRGQSVYDVDTGYLVCEGLAVRLALFLFQLNLTFACGSIN